MKTKALPVFLRALRASAFPATLAGNQGAAILANTADGGTAFAIAQPDGFFIPYGKFPHKVGMQIFDRAAADEIIAAHNGTVNKVVTWVRGAGYPVYIGHPDLPGSQDRDKKAYGWIETLTANAEGLTLGVKWSDEGRALVENAAFKFYSPLWWTRPVKGGVRPIAFKSMGLTNEPNIPVPALANESDPTDWSDPSDLAESPEPPEPEDTTMNPEILAALGLPETATPEDCLAAITALQAAAAAAQTATNEAADKCAAADAGKTAALDEAALAKKNLATAANHAVAAAVAAGRLTPAEAPAKTAELLAANDLAEGLRSLGELPAKIKTASETGALGGAKSRLVIAANDEAVAARQERARLVANEFERTNGGLSEGQRRRIAWERAAKKNPDMFGKSPVATA